MARSTQRWETTKAACSRRDLLVMVADGRWYFLQSPEDRRRWHQAVVQLEERGLVRVDRGRRPLRFQVIYPEEPWLLALERWAEAEMARREVAR